MGFRNALSLSTIKQGVMGGVGVIVGQVGTRGIAGTVAGLVGVKATDILTTSLLGVGGALATAYIVGMVKPSLAAFALAGGFAEVIRPLARTYVPGADKLLSGEDNMLLGRPFLSAYPALSAPGMSAYPQLGDGLLQGGGDEDSGY